MHETSPGSGHPCVVVVAGINDVDERNLLAYELTTGGNDDAGGDTPDFESEP
jgi:hypothetical protein